MTKIVNLNNFLFLRSREPKAAPISNYVLAFLKSCERLLPKNEYEPILQAYQEEKDIFKTIALARIKNALDRKQLSERNFRMLLALMDNFSDPFERKMLEMSNGTYTWHTLRDECLAWDKAGRSLKKEYICVDCGTKFIAPSGLIEGRCITSKGLKPEDVMRCDDCLLTDLKVVLADIIEAFDRM
ncbi:hypothetical protein [Calidifontibacillus erzurumensis]|uniref:hypothetical protein n=1 Tax=Calidifontibacillus erzurumensis TaxID=2741433 RepID=UPI0035B53090